MERTMAESRAILLNGDGSVEAIDNRTPAPDRPLPQEPIPIPDGPFFEIQAKHLQKENSMLRATLEAVKLQAELEALMQSQLGSLLPPGRVLSHYQVNQADQVLELIAP